MTVVDNLTDRQILQILESAKVFAVVGASANPARPVYGVMAWLMKQGYVVRPVNPGLAGQELQGQTVYASLADVPAPVDVVDVFRNSAAAGAVVDAAIAEKARLGIGVIWMQLGVIDEAAAERARAAGLSVVMDRCPKIEAVRLRRG